jgi:carbon storage regulator
MLVLSRQIGEKIVIGDPRDPLAVISVEDIRGGVGGKVRIGVTAARKIPVHRLEVADAIVREGEQRKAVPA